MELNHGFIRLSESLLRIQRDFDYGDELLLRRHGSVDGAQIRVGNCRYRIVVLPPLRSMLRETYALLRQFHDNGGEIIAVQQVPNRIEGSHSEELEAFLEAAATVVPNERQGDPGSPGRELRFESRVGTATVTRFPACSVRNAAGRTRGSFSSPTPTASDACSAPCASAGKASSNYGTVAMTRTSYPSYAEMTVTGSSLRSPSRLPGRGSWCWTPPLRPRLGTPVRERVVASITVAPPLAARTALSECAGPRLLRLSGRRGSMAGESANPA